MKQIMLDIETLGTNSNATILSIGAVAFTFDYKIHDSIHIMLGENDSGSIIDTSTVMWWMTQSEEARMSISKKERHSFISGLSIFSSWVEGIDNLEGVWGNGAAFDNVILKNAYIRNNMKLPFSYKQDRCYRTICAINDDVEYESFDGIEHNALDDARNQALHLCKIMKNIYKK